MGRKAELVKKTTKFYQAIVAQPLDSLEQRPVQMPPLDPSSDLASRIGPQSRHFFCALKIDTQWLEEPVASWEEIPAYQRFSKFAKSLPIANDAAERMVKRTTDFVDYGGRKEEDFQGTLHLVGKALEKVPDRSTKAALVKAYGHKE